MPRPINNKRKVTRIGKTALGVMLPAGDLRQLGWREKQIVIVKRVPKGFLIMDAKTKKRK